MIHPPEVAPGRRGIPPLAAECGWTAGTDTTPAAEESAAERFVRTVESRPDPASTEFIPVPSPAALQLSPSHLPPAVGRMVSSPASPLESAQRARFEPLLRQCLADVRLHVGSEADAAARSAGAHALTVGTHVGFAYGRYAPGTPGGDRVLAHELAHVAQQTAHGAARLRYFLPQVVARQVGLFLRYRKLFELIANEETKPSWLRLDDFPLLITMRELVFALDARDTPRVREAVALLLKKLPKTQIDPSTQFNLEEVVVRLIGDTLQLGLFDESRELRKAFTAEKGWIGLRSEQEDREFLIFRDLVDRAIQEQDLSGPAAAEASIDRMLRVFQSITRELPPFRGINEWEKQLETLAQAALVTFQTLMDAATAELESGSSRTVELTRARQVLGRMGGSILPHYPEEAVPLIEVSRSDFDHKPMARHLDFFRRDRAAPFVDITAYGRGERPSGEKQLGLRRVLEIRAEQLNALELIFGHERDERGQVTARSGENAAAIGAIGGFHLHDNESWRRFTLEKFRLAKARLGDEAQALSATIGVLRTYLETFTIHTPHNIDDFGEEYLSKNFPRALTGQLLHDCGVYALRVAYALSLVRTELDLEFHAIVLPVHLGLIITFKNREAPVFLVHNNLITELDEDDLADRRERWVKSKGPLAMRFERSDFLAHIAASEYIEGVDLPYRIEEIPQVPDVRDIKRRHSALWSFYEKKLVFPEVLRPAGGEPQPELLYLAVMDSERLIHDTFSVPLWTKAFEWWTRNEKTLEAARDRFHPRTTLGPLLSAPPIEAANVMFRETVRPQWEELWKISQDWRGAMAEHQRLRQAVIDFMKAHPEAVTPGASLTHWGNLVLPSPEERAFWHYVGDPGSEAERLETNPAAAFKKVESLANSALLSGDILPEWSIPNLLRPVD
jgi:hypothetical protein